MDTMDSHPVPEQKTLVLVNTFVAQTVELLNRFSTTCERKLADAKRRIDSVDITLKILEAKINSVEGLESVAGWCINLNELRLTHGLKGVLVSTS